MKLYVSPGACSLAPHIVLLASGLPFVTERVSLRTKLTASGEDFRTINPRGYVPALVLEDGRVLTENQVVLQYLADQAPSSGLAPALGSFERYQLMELLAWLSTELHKRFTPLFTPGTDEQARQAAWAALAAPLSYAAGKIADDAYLTGAQFTVADAYLFTILGWVGFAKYSLDDWPALQAYQARVASLPVVREALRREGLSAA
jgi:glutathione S-transferase